MRAGTVLRPGAVRRPRELNAVGLFRKKEKEPLKDDGSNKSWGGIIRDMPRMPTTHDMAKGTANAASFLKNMANSGDASRLRSTGLRGTATIHAFTDTGNKVGINHVMEVQLMVHVDGRPDYPVTHQESMAPIVVNGLASGKQLTCHVDPDNAANIVIDF
jgi:hypothetical protein